MAHKTGLDLNMFTLGDYDLLQDLNGSVSFNGSNTELDFNNLTQLFARTGAGQGVVEISFSCTTQFSSGNCARKVSSQDLSAFSFSGTPYISVIESIRFALTCEHRKNSGINDQFQAFKTVKADVEVDATAMVLSNTSNVWFNTFTGVGSTMDATWSMTLNGGTITVPGVLTAMDYVIADRDINLVTVKLKGNPACTGAFPTAPTSGSSLLTDLIVDPQTALVLKFKSQASNAEIMQVNVLLKSLEFSVNRDQEVVVNYTFTTTGNPAQSIT